jgi:hypothetical protein
MTSPSTQARDCRHFLNRNIVILMLLFAVPALSTLAKTSWYLPQADTGHYLTGAIKMKVAHSPIVSQQVSTQRVIKVIPRPQIRTNRLARLEPEVPSIGVRVSLEHRSPPSQDN